MALQEEIDAKRREIFTEGYPMSVGELLNIYADGDLDIHPEFQRFFRWSQAQKSRFIESLLLGIPIPSIFVHQRMDGVWDVVDGLQRLSTIFEFVGVLKNEAGELLPPSELETTEYLPSLAGKVWEDDDEARALTRDQQRLIKRAAIDLKIVKRESDEDTKYDLFQRLNTGGSQLSDQELRNCLLIMVSRDFYSWLREIQQVEAFQRTTALSDRALDEQYDAELALRFLAIRDATEAQLRSVRDMSDFLTGTSVAFARDQNYDREAARAGFVDTFAILDAATGDDTFRRFDRERDRFLGGFSVSAFEAITAGVYAHLPAWIGLEPAERSALLRERIAALWGDDNFRARSGSGIRASSRIPHTIPIGRQLFAP